MAAPSADREHRTEITYGISRFAGRNAALLDAQAWLGGLFDDGLLTALPLTASGAEVAGELRAERAERCRR